VSDRELVEFVRGVAARAGALLSEGAFVAHAADAKQNANDLVTEYDRRAEALIVGAIAERFPGDRVVAEEGGARGPAGGRRWLIDPLDGTTNFSHGLPFFCTSIAVEIDGELAAGVVEAPALGWSFAAERGAGAWLSARGGAGATRLAVSGTAALSRALLATGFPTDNATDARNNFEQFVHLYKCTQGVRRVGAAALDLAMTAAGWFDGYWEMKLKPWDLAAGALLVTEAGGRVSAWDGGPFAVDAGEIVATNGRIHDELVHALGDVPRAAAR
jgi:myo-inositol-1(or 4)-monophosphatase